MIKMSLIIPCYNEEKNLPLLIKECGTLPNTIEVIIVDNGSTDNSSQVLQQLVANNDKFKIVTVEQNQGYGFGILSGLRAATSEIIGWTHADLQTHPSDCIKGLQLFEEKAGNVLVKGNRYGRPLADSIFTWGMSIVEFFILGKWLWDINAQPNIFPKSFFDKLQNPPNDFSLDLYIYYQAKKHKLKVVRFPVHFGKRAFGVSSWNLNWSEKYKFIKRTLQFSTKLHKYD